MTVLLWFDGLTCGCLLGRGAEQTQAQGCEAHAEDDLDRNMRRIVGEGDLHAPLPETLAGLLDPLDGIAPHQHLAAVATDALGDAGQDLHRVELALAPDLERQRLFR